MIDHSLYGLSVRSNRTLPGVTLAGICGKPDVKVTLGRLPEWIGQKKDRTRFFPTELHDERLRPSLLVWRYRESGDFWLIYEDGTEFVIDNEGRHIWTVWPDSLTLEDMATYLLGPVFGFLLRLRGVLCLHASGVVVQGGGVAILGPPGAGKSTIAAAFADLGYAVLTDDVLPWFVTRMDSGPSRVIPGYASGPKRLGLYSTAPTLCPALHRLGTSATSISPT